LSENIFHLAEADHWSEAVASGHYTWSTLGRTLDEEGFIHASEAHQWEATRGRFYASYPKDLVLLTIDPSLLDVPLVREVGNPATGEEFPHIYGPLPVEAVVATTALRAPHGA
jgi:Uncharacterized protein conserved in bacteria